MNSLTERLRAAVGTAGDERDQLLVEAAQEIELARLELALERAKRRTRCAGGKCRTEPPYPQKPLQIGRAFVSVQFRWEYPPRLEPTATWVCAVTGMGPHELQMSADDVRRARDWFTRAFACVSHRNKQRAADKRRREKQKGKTHGPDDAKTDAGTGAGR